MASIGGPSGSGRRSGQATAGGVDTIDTVKRTHKRNKKSDRYATKRRKQRRNRRTALFVVSVVCALLAVMAADYLLNGGEALRETRLSEPATSEKEEPVVSTREAVEDRGVGASEPSVLLGEFFTDYAWDPDPGRRSNLEAASEAIDGTILKPGEEFSAIEVLGQVEYKPAKVFASGGIDYTEGGGLCQVSSTLYMAANYAGLEITERNPHYAELPYIKPGLDATVWFGEPGNGWGALDMRFKNNTDGDILLRQHINEDGFMVAQIYGEKPTGKVVTMNSEKVEQDPNRGIKWATYKTVKDSNGKVLEDGLLFETVYSYNPPTPPEIKHETYEPRGAGWVDVYNTTNWNEKD